MEIMWKLCLCAAFIPTDGPTYVLRMKLLCFVLNFFVDKDAGRWKDIDAKEIQRRRQAFWELYVYDVLQVGSNSRSYERANNSIQSATRWADLRLSI